jgi:hypothetical protein
MILCIQEVVLIRKLEVIVVECSTNDFPWIFSGGSVSCNGVNTTSWTNPSDHRIKEKIKESNI